MRTVFVGSPPFATPVLRRLLGGPQAPVALVTQPERPAGRGRRVELSPLVELARGARIEVLQPEKATDPGFLARVAALAPDVLFVVSYGKILRPELVALARRVSLNVHPSLLPRHRGATPIPAALLAGDEVTGVTIQKVSAELDAGDILCAVETSIGDEEHAGELGARLAELSAELSEEALGLVAAGKAVFTPQDPSRATYCGKLEKEDGRFDFRRPAAELVRHVRAMTPWPGARIALAEGGELGVLRAQALDADEPGGGRAGELLARAGRFVVRAGAGALELLEVQPQGKRPMSGAEYLRGRRFAPGLVFPGLP